MRAQHYQNADEADDHSRPAKHAYMLIEKYRRQRDGDQRRDEGNGGGIDDRKPGQRREIAEHAADADQAAPDMPERAPPPRARCATRRSAPPEGWRRRSARTRSARPDTVR